MTQVHVEEGILEGEIVEREISGKFYSFKGIPYAKPPVGELRFKAPEPAIRWEGVRTAKEFGPICPQYDMFTHKIRDGSEDCLYLNVYSPNVKPTQPLPVMVWIHGGGFMSGSGNDNFYGPDYLIRHGIVLVTFNYRLEVLGFLCLNSEDVPGNAGMKDQVAALRWVQNNIHSFGGDPLHVTIFGESAGGASVGYHLISPMSKGLFRRAIAQSGCAENWWSRTYNPRERAKVLARKMGIDSNDDKELYNFFKSVPVEKLILKSASLTWADEFKQGTNLQFTVVEEKLFGNRERFYYNSVFTDTQNFVHEDVEVMAGYTKDEGLLTIGLQCDIEKMLYQANYICQYFVPNALIWKRPLKDQLEAAKKIQKYYFKDKIIHKTNLEPLIKFTSMDLFIYGIITWAKRIATAGKNKIYLYKFCCHSQRNVMSKQFGASEVMDTAKAVCHSDDLAYLFPLKELTTPVDVNTKEFQLINTVTKLWTNFAKFGDPTSNESKVKWRPLTTGNEDYMNICEKLCPSTEPEKEEMVFWEHLLRDN